MGWGQGSRGHSGARSLLGVWEEVSGGAGPAPGDCVVRSPQSGQGGSSLSGLGQGGALKGQLSFHPRPRLGQKCLLPEDWVVGRTLSAAVQNSLSKNRDNVSHLTGKVIDRGNLSELAFLLTCHLSALFSACWLYSQVGLTITGKDAPQPAPGPHLASSVAPVEPFLMVSAIVSELTCIPEAVSASDHQPGLHDPLWSLPWKSSQKTGTGIPNQGHP